MNLRCTYDKEYELETEADDAESTYYTVIVKCGISKCLSNTWKEGIEDFKNKSKNDTRTFCYDFREDNIDLNDNKVALPHYCATGKCATIYVNGTSKVMAQCHNEVKDWFNCTAILGDRTNATQKCELSENRTSAACCCAQRVMFNCC